MALFSTLIICSYNTYNIISRGNKSTFCVACVVLINLIVSNLGYDFIVQYLYVVSAIISGLYVVILICLMVYTLIKFNCNKSKELKTAQINKRLKYIIIVSTLEQKLSNYNR